jgi:hypothetical protein
MVQTTLYTLMTRKNPLIRPFLDLLIDQLKRVFRDIVSFRIARKSGAIRSEFASR